MDVKEDTPNPGAPASGPIDTAYAQFKLDLDELRRRHPADATKTVAVVMRRFRSLTASDAFVAAHRTRVLVMQNLCMGLDSVFRNGLFSSYTSDPRAFASGVFPYPDTMGPVFDAHVEEYFKTKENFGRAARGFFAKMLAIPPDLTQAGELSGPVIAAASDPWVITREVSPEEHLARFGCDDRWSTNLSARLQAACSWLPDDLRSAESIVDAWEGNLGLEMYFPRCDPNINADYNWVIFGRATASTVYSVPMYTSEEDATTIVSIALFAFAKMLRGYSRLLEELDKTGYMGDRGVAAIAAGYTLPFAIHVNVHENIIPAVCSFALDIIAHQHIRCRRR